MPIIIDLDNLIMLSKGENISQIQQIFYSILSNLIDYLRLKPINKEFRINLLLDKKYELESSRSILDLGVIRLNDNGVLILNIISQERDFLPFILLREAFYSFLPNDTKENETIKIYINQIVENELENAVGFKKWHDLIRDKMVDKEFLFSQLDRLKRFFKIDTDEIHETPVQFFFKDMHENAKIIGTRNIINYYDEIFEKYMYKTSKSLHNEEIIKTIIIFLKIFYKNKKYLNISDYLSIYRDIRQKDKLELSLSIRKFYENLQWINKCTSIAPSYNIVYNAIGISPITCELIFNPLISRFKIKKLLRNFPFKAAPKVIENSFATKIVIALLLPTIYMKDILSYFNKLYANGYLIGKKLFLYKNTKISINFNYYLNERPISKLVDPLLKNYKKEFEFQHLIKFPSNVSIYPLSFLEYIILFRIRFYSVTGLTFDKRIETLNAIKEEIKNEYRKQLNYINNFRDNFNTLASIQLKEEFLSFLKENQRMGLFVLLENCYSIIKISTSIEKILKENPKIRTIQKLKLFLREHSFSNTLEENLMVKENYAKKVVFNEIFPTYFKSKMLYKEEIDKIKLYYNLINSCFNFKLFSIKTIISIIKTPEKITEIIKKKEKKNRKVFKLYKSYKITNEKIESTLNKFLVNDPPIIVPMLLNTIMTSQFAKFYPEVFLRDTPEVQRKIERLKSYFPRLFIDGFIHQDTHENLIHILLYSINFQEKKQFISSLNNLFKENLIAVRRNYWRGLMRISNVEAKDFYDFANKQFIYTKDFFEQFFAYTQNVLGDLELLPYNKDNILDCRNLFWLPDTNLDKLVDIIKKRVSHQKIKYDLNIINELSEFRTKLDYILIEKNKITNIKSKDFFKIFIDSIRLIPAFRKFGLGQYYLYFCPHDWSDVDLKLIFLNTFQRLFYPAQIDLNQPIFIRSLFPYRRPNKSYINWLVKSKKAVREYCLFFVKKLYDIFHINHSLSTLGWQYSANRFKNHIQNILFNLNNISYFQNIREFNLDQHPNTRVYGLGTSEFEELSQIYKWHSLNIKSYLGTKKQTIIDNFISLLRKRLIFPYIKLKNLDLQDKVTIILPNLNADIKKKILQIFYFFNVCRIYQIEGEFYIYGFEEPKSFETGFMIEIWFPKCELDEFFDVFDLLFEYLEIRHYLILTDLVEGETLLKNVFGDLNFLDEYNPLFNLKWDEKDKIWINHKVFNEKFEPIYPDLIREEKQYS